MADELSWSFVGHLSNVCRQVLEEVLCTFSYQRLRESMASGIRQVNFEVVCPFFLASTVGGSFKVRAIIIILID